MRNMNNSILEEPIIHLIIWIRNGIVMNEEDDEAETRSLPMKQIKIVFNCHFMILFCNAFVYIQLMYYA